MIVMPAPQKVRDEIGFVAYHRPTDLVLDTRITEAT